MPAKEVRAGRKIMERSRPPTKDDLCYNVLPGVKNDILSDIRTEASARNPDSVRLAQLANELTFTERLHAFCPTKYGGVPILRGRYGESSQ